MKINFLQTILSAILNVPRPLKRLIAIVVDICLCVFCLWFSFYLRLGEFVPLTSISISAILASIFIAIPIFTVHGLYRAIFRFSGWSAMWSVARSISLYGLVYVTIFTVIGVHGVPRTVGLIQPILLLFFVGFSRMFVRFWLGNLYLEILRISRLPKVLIYGAGITGRQLAEAVSHGHDQRVVGFIDDDRRLHGSLINGKPVYSPESLSELVGELEINDILLALPGISRYRRNQIISSIGSLPVGVRTLPRMLDLAKGKISVSDISELDVDDLLLRQPISADELLLRKNVTEKVILVTGAGGSIGGELCRQIAKLGPSKLLLIDQSEFNLYRISLDLEDKGLLDSKSLVPLLASVLDERRMRHIMNTWRPDIIFHAAAYKHVPIVELNQIVGVENNVFGTLALAKIALDFQVSNFVLVSTDKAVRPTNAMGAGKRIAELILQALDKEDGETIFSIVRFGNVLDSSGSVVPKFRKQIRDGGPVTLTHPDVERFFMTIPEAAQLVIQSVSLAEGGEVFVLDMGDPVKIGMLAERMIALSGLTLKNAQHPKGDIEIKIVGLRPGEKLFEELLIGKNPEPTAHPRIIKATESSINWISLCPELEKLRNAFDANDINLMRRVMIDLVDGYVPSDVISDLVYLEVESNQSC